jgi:hypothetical protein
MKGRVRTVKQRKFWKRHAGAIAMLILPALGKADVILDWNLIMQAIVTTQPPFPQARFAAITQLAVFEAVNSITHDYQPYLGTITASPGASPEAATITAAHTVLKSYFPASALSLDAARATSLAAILDGTAKNDGIAVGEAAAAAIMAARANDGSSPPAFFLPPSANPGDWQLTPSCTAAGGAFFHWQNVTPFGIISAGQFRIDPPPELAGGRYAEAYNEVKEVGDINSTQRPQDRTNVALFYASVTPVRIFNPIARLLSASEGKSLSENAHDFAILNMAISDAAVATFEAKYHYNFWRPETAIHDAALDGNDRTDPDATFKPLVITPCFPSYPSAHGTLSNAARDVMERAYGNVSFAITLSTPAVPGVSLTYTNLKQITDDISDARVYGGIHFRTDQKAGGLMGSRLGQWVYEHNLRRVGGEDAGSGQ